jgi:hypothetical protein
MITEVATFSKFGVLDTILLATILLIVIGIPVSIVFLIDRPSEKPPPLPPDVEQSRK